MARLTITLSDDRHMALKEESARRGKPIGQIIEESLEQAGIRSRREAVAIIERVRKRAQLSDEEALRLATEETRAVRSS